MSEPFLTYEELYESQVEEVVEGVVEGAGATVTDVTVAPVVELPRRLAWEGTDLGPILRGELRDPPPDILERADRKCCLYRAKLNVLFGPSEGAKSWLSLYAKAQRLLAGDVVCLIDYEDSAITAVRRLRLLGVPDELIERNFIYISPEGGLDLGAFQKYVMPREPTMLTLDAATAAAGRSGIDTNNDGQITRWIDTFLRPVARMGLAVVMIDHTGKDGARGQRGSSAKKDAVDGVALYVEPRALIAPGRRGVSAVIVAKDRPGLVRENAINGTLFGDFIIDESGGTPDVQLVAGMPNPREVMRRRVLEALAGLSATADQPASTRDVQGATGRRDATGKVESQHASLRTVQTVLNELAAAGQVHRRQVGQAFSWWLA